MPYMQRFPSSFTILQSSATASLYCCSEVTQASKHNLVDTTSNGLPTSTDSRSTIGVFVASQGTTDLIFRFMSTSRFKTACGVLYPSRSRTTYSIKGDQSCASSPGLPRRQRASISFGVLREHNAIYFRRSAYKTADNGSSAVLQIADFFWGFQRARLSKV